jgi:hypothetical protein
MDSPHVRFGCCKNSTSRCGCSCIAARLAGNVSWRPGRPAHRGHRSNSRLVVGNEGQKDPPVPRHTNLETLEVNYRASSENLPLCVGSRAPTRGFCSTSTRRLLISTASSRKSIKTVHVDSWQRLDGNAVWFKVQKHVFRSAIGARRINAHHF